MKGKTPIKRRGRGFERTSSLVQPRVRDASASRGFAVSRLLTHWSEIVGEDTASVANPVDVKYGRGGLGATLTLLTTGAQAPMLEMQKDKIKERVNACYGYSAISRVRITQTAPTGFAEGHVDFSHAPAKPMQKRVAPELKAKAARATSAIGDESLRAALERLGENILSNQKNPKVPS